MPRILTYNVHSCRGMDGTLSPERIAAVIAAAQPDIVALQELDVGRARTGGLDQAHSIARALGMEFHFHPALRVEEEAYGDAVLSALPMRLIKAGPLPGLAHRPMLEPRGALWVAVELGDGSVLQVINTHLGLAARERLAQVEALLGEAWLGHPTCRGRPAVLLGDFNAVPRSVAYRRIAAQLRDAQRMLPGQKPRPTFPSRWPLLRIDHVFLSVGVEARSAEVRRGPLERLASDHLPLVVDLSIRRQV
ncbi:endonuclease/exonuclease/phosphatase family protein [Belnapia sp. T6]|uniref:Endonuclease/exonuclease/phosphatase family protein n=1 Tax=Belnapia mucosa TaxID=2804532 RepID=A0ABS1VBP2_9PROT|nr:endonuclease/exonuclease/phosphatase family protein [Belnapia mucosa]MBL6459105.1 endonuclease/exonuclease/phosphatase family protein [Belnapia mucosa]